VWDHGGTHGDESLPIAGVALELFDDAESAGPVRELLSGCAAGPHTGDQFAALEQMWRHPAPETQLVLDALGQHLPGRKLAKAARTFAIKHHSWIANRN
jgi:hypothetical protein